MTILFPKILIVGDSDILVARKHADRLGYKLNSYEGTFQGELGEIILTRELKKTYNVIENNEEETRQYKWDLKIDGKYIDVKTTKAKTITITDIIEDCLYPCYLFKKTNFELLGVLNGIIIKKIVKKSKFNNGYYLWNSDVIKNSIQ